MQATGQRLTDLYRGMQLDWIGDTPASLNPPRACPPRVSSATRQSGAPLVFGRGAGGGFTAPGIVTGALRLTAPG
jgi:hypothetical protein